MQFITDFHFLRPWLLCFCIPAALLLWYAFRTQNGRSGMQSLIAGHLLEHLLLDSGGKKQEKVRPISLLALFWSIAIIALAGPSWQKEASPFAEDTAGLVLVLKVTPSMLAQDIQPSRLERATQKIHDLLELRPGTRTALIAYGGSAHLTMPFTVDAGIIDMFSQALSPEIMPEEGDAAAEALKLAAKVVTKAEIPGSILLISDQIAGDQLPVMEKVHKQSVVPVHIFAVAADKGVSVPPGSPPGTCTEYGRYEKSSRYNGCHVDHCFSR